MSADAPIEIRIERRFPRRIPWIQLAVCLAVVGGLGTWLFSAVQKARNAARAAATT